MHLSKPLSFPRKWESIQIRLDKILFYLQREIETFLFQRNTLFKIEYISLMLNQFL